MIHDLNQFQIESLDEEDYSLFLAYGDTFNDTPSVSAGTGGNLLWKTETTRLDEQIGIEVLQFGKRLRRTFNQGSPSDSYLVC